MVKQVHLWRSGDSLQDGSCLPPRESCTLTCWVILPAPGCLDFKVQTLKTPSQAHGKKIWCLKRAWATWGKTSQENRVEKILHPLVEVLFGADAVTLGPSSCALPLTLLV